MMISPEGYYEEYLKGKSAEQKMTIIPDLKKVIGHPKNTMEHPDYGEQPTMHSSKSIRLWCTCLYLERVKEAFSAMGETYKLLQAELKASDFDLILKPTNPDVELDYPCSKDEFLDGLRELHIGEWHSKYDLYSVRWNTVGIGDLLFH